MCHFLLYLNVKCQEENGRKNKKNRVEGYYIYDSYIDLTAEQIMKGWYPEDTEFRIKDNDIYVSIPLCDLECQYIEETEFNILTS